MEAPVVSGSSGTTKQFRGKVLDGGLHLFGTKGGCTERSDGVGWWWLEGSRHVLGEVTACHLGFADPER
jgi:hypothetical protein